MSDEIRLSATTVNAPDALALTTFSRLDFQPNSDHCFVYADPTGHPFCLSTWDGPHLDEPPRGRD